MEKIILIDASPRVGNSSQVTDYLSEHLNGQYEIDRLNLRDFDVNNCVGCCLCLTTGSSACPFSDDDAHRVLKQMLAVKGVIWIVPNYSLNIPGKMKTLFDRLAFVFHRPRLFGKVSWPIVVQGVYGGGKVAKYINEIMSFWGAAPVTGTVVNGGVDPHHSHDLSSVNIQKIQKGLAGFHAAMEKTTLPSPSLMQMAIFRATRTAMIHSSDVLQPDKEYYAKNGWSRSPYYYPCRINPISQIAGNVVDSLIRKQIKNPREQ